MVFGGLLCFRQTRRTGILGFATTCAVVALIVAGTEIAAGGRTIGHVLTATAVIGFLFPIVGAAPACAIIGSALLLRAFTRRTLRAIFAFTGDVRTDVRRVVKRPTSGQERGLRTLSRASLLSLTFLALAGITLFGLNIESVSNFATRFAPRLSIVTNVLDLLSLILVTPKFFAIETRDNIRDLSVEMLRSFTINKINIPRNTITAISFGIVFVFVSLLVIVFLVMTYNRTYGTAHFLVLIETLDKIYPTPFAEYIVKQVLEYQRVETKIWPFIIATFIINIVLTVSMILLSALAKQSPEDQKKLEDKLLFCGLVLFAYSRALSMID